MSKEEKSRIFIEFEDNNSAIFSIKFENVVPGQILAVSAFLDFEGKNQLAVQRAAQLQAEMQNKIAVPKPKLVQS